MVIDARANKGSKRGAKQAHPAKELAYGPLVALLEDDPITRLVYAGAGGGRRADTSFFIVEPEDDGGGFGDATRERDRRGRESAAARSQLPDRAARPFRDPPWSGGGVTAQGRMAGTMSS